MTDVSSASTKPVSPAIGNSPKLLRPEALRLTLLWVKDHTYEPGESRFDAAIPVHWLWLIQEGSLEFTTDDFAGAANSGECYLGVPCARRRMTAPRGSKWLSIGFLVTETAGRDPLLRVAGGAWRPEASERAWLAGTLRALLQAETWAGEGGALARDGLARAAMGWLLHSGQLRAETESGPDWLRELLGTIEVEPGLGAAELAARAHFSPAQFRRLFAKYVGLSPRDYLLHRRLERARESLEGTDLSVEEVAHRTGWGGPTQLAREFTRTYGTSPSKWRASSRRS